MLAPPTTTPSPPQPLQTTRLPTHLTAVAVLGRVDLEDEIAGQPGQRLLGRWPSRRSRGARGVTARTPDLVAGRDIVSDAEFECRPQTARYELAGMKAVQA